MRIEHTIGLDTLGEWPIDLDTVAERLADITKRRLQDEFPNAEIVVEIDPVSPTRATEISGDDSPHTIGIVQGIVEDAFDELCAREL